MSLIGSNDTWFVLAAMIGTVALGVWLEKKYLWAAKISALVIIVLLSIIISNINIIPSSAPVYDFVWEYCLPLALPLLLFKSDVRKICKESGQLLIAFVIGAMGTVAGAFISYFIFKNYISELPGISAMMTGTYIGGSVNFAVLSSAFDVSVQSVSAATIADNLNMAIYFIVLLSIPVRSKIIKSENLKQESKKEDNQFSVRSLAIGLAIATMIIAISDLVSGEFTKLIPTSNFLLSALQSMCGNRYMWITTFSVLLATICSEKLGKLSGLQEIGTFFIYCFMFVIGAPASIAEIVKKSPLLLLFAMLIVAFNMLFTFGIGSLLHMDRKMLIIESNANIGGPTTAASMAIAKDWNELIGPSLLVGCFGYAIGNYLGILVGTALS